MPPALVAALELIAWIVGGALVWRLVCGRKRTASDRRQDAMDAVNQWYVAVPRIAGRREYGRRITKHS